MRVRTAVAQLLKENPEYRRLFKSCCETSAFRLRAQTWQFRDELRERGQDFPRADLEDALMGLARKFFPESPAAEWDDEWASSLCKDALARFAEHCMGLSKEERDALNLTGEDVWLGRMEEADLANDPAGFRAAVKGWERALVETLEKVRAA